MAYNPKRPGETYQVDGSGQEIEQKDEKKGAKKAPKAPAEATQES